MFQFGDYPGHACSVPDIDKRNTMAMGFVAVSNRMVLFPDGLPFEAGDGMLGVGYVKTPLGKVNASDPRNFWTLVLDAENFAGPVGYFLPEFWARRCSGMSPEAGARFKDFGTAYGNFGIISMCCVSVWPFRACSPALHHRTPRRVFVC